MADYLAIAERALREYQARKPRYALPVTEDTGEEQETPAIEQPQAAPVERERQPAVEEWERPPVTEATTKPRPTWHLAPIPPERQAEEARRRLDAWGWCGILARKIGDDAVVILCEDPARVRADLAWYWPVFTLREIEALSPDGIEAAKAAYAEKLAALGGEPHA